MSAWRIIAAGAWLLATYALAGWWLIFGLRQLERLSELDIAAAAELARQHRMLMGEGMSLFVLLFVGGASLLYYIWSEFRRTRQIAEFFSAFSHDLKTSLASLRLQAESLEEDLGQTAQARIARRVVKDTVRLELQLENSLFLASPDSDSDLYYEDIELDDAVARLRHQWPDLAIEIAVGGRLRADRRALESILKNLLQNAVVHGKASRAIFRMAPAAGQGRVFLHVQDNGSGFVGKVSALGPIFFRRHAPSSGSGIGLPLAMRLARQMGGELQPLATESGSQGFCVRIELHGQMQAQMHGHIAGQNTDPIDGPIARPAAKI